MYVILVFRLSQYSIKLSNSFENVKTKYKIVQKQLKKGVSKLITKISLSNSSPTTMSDLSPPLWSGAGAPIRLCGQTLFCLNIFALRRTLSMNPTVEYLC